LTQGLKQRFDIKWKLNEITGCWEWTAYRDKDGYGNIQVNKSPRQAHRISYILYVGGIPPNTLVCHSCDNPGCVNPDHLFLGTPKLNMEDKYNKNRQIHVRGEEVGNSKLSTEDVKHIRSSSFGNQQLAKYYGVTHSLISAIRLNKCWKHV
jgi:hypothetical protein